jgi:DNA-binding HxlR family transcriptional regulator/putative sterol carrier protein
MKTRGYGKYCGLAHALELVGERWALVLVSDLLRGPKRFSELQRGQPRIPSNVLSARLKELEDAGVVRRRVLPRPASGVGYELTEYGRELEDIVVALGRWGAKTIQPRSAGQAFKPEWFVVALLGSFRPESARGIRATYEIRLDGTVFHLRIERGRLEHGRGPAKDADLVIETESDSLFAVLMGQITAADAVAAGNVKIDGSLDELQKMIKLFALREAETAGAEP